MPVAKTGHSDTPVPRSPASMPAKRYYLSILPDGRRDRRCTTTAAGGTASCYTMTGAPVVCTGGTTTDVPVIVNAQPLPPAQMRIFAFEDTAPINNAWDAGEAGLGGFTIFIYDMAGQMVTDVFGNPLGTATTRHARRRRRTDDHPTGRRHDAHDDCGRGRTIRCRNPYQLKVGEALIQNIAPGKYGVQIVPPEGQGWQQTTTIEGTKGIDVVGAGRRTAVLRRVRSDV